MYQINKPLDGINYKILRAGLIVFLSFFQKTFGKRATNVILGEISKEGQMFEEGHKKGSQSNSDLHKAMNTHINNLKLLSSPLEELQKLLPSLDKAQGKPNV